MKLLELSIENVRGLPSLSLKPDGKNLVIWGPNGSGKSAVVDALDFLLTGEITRLMGKGTGGITLAQHGPHIGHQAKEAKVTGTFRVPGVEEPVTISRCMARPTTLECPKDVKAILEPILNVAGRGQHVLTRREILRYITAEAGTRAQQIQELLSVSDVEEIRKALVRVDNDADKDLKSAQNNVTKDKGSVIATAQLRVYDPPAVLDLVNRCRAVLGGSPAVASNSSALKQDLIPPSSRTSDNPMNIAMLEKDVENLHRCLKDDVQTEAAETDAALRKLITDVRADPSLLKALRQVELIQLGMSLLDETGACPLCDTAWAPGALKELLEQKSSLAAKAKDYQRSINTLAGKLAQSTTALSSSIQKVVDAVRLVGKQADLDALQQWQSRLAVLTGELGQALDKYSKTKIEPSDVKQLLSPPNLGDMLQRVLEEAKARFPKATPEQTAWDTLTRLEENLKSLEASEEQYAHARLAKARAALLLESFQNGRDKVLGELYDSIRDRFVDLYRKLHGDEAGFKAKLEPDGAGLTFEVDFYGRGTHPPHALHSEGHQDSMGLCLYLALAERLTSGVIDLVVLDDVVMSVDADHRRQLCTLLATEFKDRQFIITTHDRTWAYQLRSEGVVTRNGTIELHSWNVDTGPQVNAEVDLWERIDSDLKRADVPAAAAKLRRGSEDYFAKVCDALQAKVPFKLTGRHELGDLIHAAISRYRELLKSGRRAAQSWTDTTTVERFKELESTSATVIARTQAEQWAVNANVHYNAWADFTARDLLPVVQSFHDLHDLYSCSQCGSLLRVVMDETEAVSVRCNGNHVNWNLTEKK